MRKRLFIATTLVMLVSAATAVAAAGPYSGSISFGSKKAGTAKKPVPINFTLNVKAAAPAGSRAPVQSVVKVKIYGVRDNGKNFPTCSVAKIAAAHNDTVCPKGARVATGYITSTLGSTTNFTQAGAACDPQLDVWNAGPGKNAYFFVTNAAHQCLGGAVKTGSTPPYGGTYKVSGGYLITDVPSPNYITHPLPGLVGSLETEHLVFSSQTAKVRGTKVYSQSSVGCLKGKRPYSVSSTWNLPTSGPALHVSTFSGSAACS
ncbi:MAG: hypothetical protein WAL63_21095 [Solirubrobacteraceae bacterium]